MEMADPFNIKGNSIPLKCVNSVQYWPLLTRGREFIRSIVLQTKVAFYRVVLTTVPKTDVTVQGSTDHRSPDGINILQGSTDHRNPDEVSYLQGSIDHRSPDEGSFLMGGAYHRSTD